MSRTRTKHVHKVEYAAWAAMKQRCLNPSHPKFRDCGGKGVKIEQAWSDSFAAFFAALGPRPSKKHSLGRLGEKGDYVPGNTVWRIYGGHGKAYVTDRRGHRHSVRSFQKEYDVWLHMRARRVRDRNTVIDPTWENSFKVFLADVGQAPTPEHTFSRIDASGPYVIGNVEWRAPSVWRVIKKASRAVVTPEIAPEPVQAPVEPVVCQEPTLKQRRADYRKRIAAYRASPRVQRRLIAV